MENLVSLLSTLFWSLLILCVLGVACVHQMLVDEKKRKKREKYEYEQRNLIAYIERFEL